MHSLSLNSLFIFLTLNLIYFLWHLIILIHLIEILLIIQLVICSLQKCFPLLLLLLRIRLLLALQ